MATYNRKHFTESVYGEWGPDEKQTIDVNFVETAIMLLLVALALIVFGAGYLFYAYFYSPLDATFYGVIALIALIVGLASIPYPVFATLSVNIDSDGVTVSRLFGTRRFLRSDLLEIRSMRRWQLEVTTLSGRNGVMRFKTNALEPTPLHLLLYRWANQSAAIPELHLPLKLKPSYPEYLARTFLVTAITAVVSAIVTWALELGSSGFEYQVIAFMSGISFLASLSYTLAFSPISFEFHEALVRKKTISGDTDTHLELLEDIDWEIGDRKDELILRKANGKLRIPGTISHLPLSVLVSILSKAYLGSDGSVTPIYVSAEE